MELDLNFDETSKIFIKLIKDIIQEEIQPLKEKIAQLEQLKCSEKN